VKPTRLILIPHARDGPADRAFAYAASRSRRPGGSFTDASSSRGVPLPASRGSRAALPDEWSFPRALPRPAALLGFIPFAGFIPHPGGHDISARPGPRAVRAKSSASRFIFVGMTGRQFDSLKRVDPTGGRSCGRFGFDFWASTPVCGPSGDHRDHAGDDPAMGFASCRVDGHMTVQPGDFEDRTGSPASGAHGRAFFAGRAAPIRSWV
jgi:hypothetical protein